MSRHLFAVLHAAALLSIAIALGVMPADACTRAVYFGEDGLVITGRSMDWSEEMYTNIWVFPQGMERHGGQQSDSIQWTSKYGSVVASAYEAGTADGMNDAGLVTNLLYLVESEYPEADDRPSLVISAWAQYMLDNFATVAEAVEDAQQNHYRIVTVSAPTGKAGTVHLSISDATGDSAIFECVGGELKIHHSRDYQVMTNSPVYEQQLALNAYWEQIGGTVMLPGTNRAADRFARASFYINAIPKTSDRFEAAAAVFSVIRNASVPRGISTPDQPHISSTIWRTVADQTNLIYYYEDTASPSVFWVNLGEMDLSPESGVRRLALTGQPHRGGDQTKNFEPAEPFEFLAP